METENDSKLEVKGNELKLEVKVMHDGFWITPEMDKHVGTQDQNCDRNSVLLNPKCLLYIYKLALRHYLFTYGVISEDDMDAPNLVPHVKVRKDKRDSFSRYTSIQGRVFHLDEQSLSAKRDFLTIELDTRQDLHCTMIYAKQIGKRNDTIASFKQVVSLLHQKPNLIEQYASLPNFGQGAISYWIETVAKYPNNVVPPKDYKPQKVQIQKTATKVSLAGVILE